MRSALTIEESAEIIHEAIDLLYTIDFHAIRYQGWRLQLITTVDCLFQHFLNVAMKHVCYYHISIIRDSRNREDKSCVNIPKGVISISEYNMQIFFIIATER